MRSIRPIRLACAAFVAACAPGVAAEPPATDAAGLAFFETRVRPLLVARCQECHGPDAQQGGVRLDTRAGVFAGETGPVAVPGDAAGSRLIEVLAHSELDVGMPPEGRLNDDEIAALTAWVDRGAPWPEERAAGDGHAAADPREHWAFKPIARPPAPDAAGPTPVDRFLNAKLADAGLAAAPPAERRAQVRRLYLDLLGVPPTWDELHAALADDAPDAWPRLVDRVLADPRHGVRWARHWLDVARYADTKGYVFQEAGAYPFAWTYRDYVVAAFNADKPFDRFVTEQLAADRLAAAGELAPDAPELAAMGFLTLGPRFLNSPVLIADDRVDVVSRGLLGLTVACARCHDHKYDPIPTEDYYALYGVFRSSTEPDELPEIGEPADTPAVRAFAAERDRLAAEVDRVTREQTAAVVADLRARLGTHLAAASGRPVEENPDPPLRGAFVGRLKAALERTTPDDDKLGPWVRVTRDPAVSGEDVASLAARYDAADPADAEAAAAADRYANLPDGRFRGYVTAAERRAVDDVTRALVSFVAASPDAPPRAHVLIDGPRREWNTVFIRGDEGRRGEAIVPHAVPSILTGGALVELTAAPDAPEGVAGRWELAAAITNPANPLTARVIVNRVWAWHFGAGLVATPSDFGTRADPPSHPELLDWLASGFVANGWSLKWLHRQIVLTDAYRRAAGPAAGSAADPGDRLLARFPRRRLEFEAWRDSALAASGALDGTAAGRPADLFGESPMTRRTLFGTIDRNELPGVLRNFDVPDPESSAAERTESAVPQQALFALNGPQLSAWAGRLAAETGPDAAALYRRTLLREPTPAEVDRAAAFLAAAGPEGPAALAHALLMSNEFAFLE